MKKIIALGISFLVIVTITVFGYKIIEDAVQQAELRKGYEKLPDLVSLPLVDSSSYSLFNLSDEKGILVTHFSTECAFCESELNSVLDHGNLVAAASILLISTQPDSQLQQAKKKWNLHQYPDIYLLRDTLDTFYKIYGTRVTPATYVYDKDRRLLDSFRGFVTAEVLYNTLSVLE